MKKTLLILATGLFCWTGVHAAIIQVSVGDDLQAKINSATSGDEVRVHAGTFTGNFSFKDGVNVSGGWNDGFTAQTDYATILDANNSGRPVTSASLTKLTVWSNFKLTNGNPGDGGGGAQIRFNARLDHCLIEGNKTGGSGKAGGGAHLFNGGQLYNCIIRNDTATGDAGGVRISQYNYTGVLDCKVINCVIANNEATNRCGGIQAEVDADIIGNTIVGNNQKTNTDGDASRCGLTCAKSSSIAEGYYLANNIIWGNKHKGVVNSAQIYYISRYPAAQRANNAVYNQDTGTGSITLSADDPGFVDAANGDYSLLWNSVLVNAGSNASSQGDTDLAGNARIAGGIVDIGAYELEHYTLTISAFEHATLTLADAEKEAGAYSLPKGYTAAVTITPDSEYTLKSVTLNGEALIPVEEVYTLPALTADAVLAITVEQNAPTAMDNINAHTKAHKVIRNGQLMIIRNGETFNALGTKVD